MPSRLVGQVCVCVCVCELGQEGSGMYHTYLMIGITGNGGRGSRWEDGVNECV